MRFAQPNRDEDRHESGVAFSGFIDEHGELQPTFACGLIGVDAAILYRGVAEWFEGMAREAERHA